MRKRGREEERERFGRKMLCFFFTKFKINVFGYNDLFREC